MNYRHAAALSGLFVLALVLFRTFVSGWGPPDTVPGSSTSIGVAAYPADSLSYISWMQQAKYGAWLLSNLYTTTGHDAVMFNLLLVVVGKLSAIFSASPILILNVLGLAAVPAFVFGFYMASRVLGLGAAATFGAACLALGGGGISWVRKMISMVGLDRILPVGELGPDFSYLDLYPVAAYVVYPFHAISLAFLAVLTFVIVQCDDPARKLTVGRLALLIGLTASLAWMRPYEPVMILAAFGGVVAASVAFRLPAPVLRRRLAIMACLAGAMLPQIAYGLWIAHSPVWGDAARVSFNMPTGDWSSGFFVLWIFAGIGIAALGRRLLHSPFAFPAMWSLGCVVVLLVLDAGVWLAKFTAGGTIALALLAGAGLHGILDRLRSPRLAAATVAVVAVLAFMSPIMVVLKLARAGHGVIVSSELLRMVSDIRADAAAPIPVVLADCYLGVVLPGLGGLRVYCGHWALSDGNREKIVLLKSRLGMRASSQAIPTFPGVGEAEIAARAAELRAQVRDGVFQYLLMRRGYELYEDIKTMPEACTVTKGLDHLVLRMCPAVVTVLEKRLL